MSEPVNLIENAVEENIMNVEVEVFENTGDAVQILDIVNEDIVNEFHSDESGSYLEELEETDKLELDNVEIFNRIGRFSFGSNAPVPFAEFLVLVNRVSDAYNEMVKIYQSAEYNKETCGNLLDKVQIAHTAVSNLKNLDENDEYFSQENFDKLDVVVAVVVEIRELAGEFTQLTSLSEYEDKINKINDKIIYFDSNMIS
ncbi:9569_t:CDS:2 [Funneliformis geosporum]|uniref:5382_t:CDS:1 n=1 Tax=Funneliformis geosporum TaxID=1117311 RepID=A0A9W4SMX1_9GLOM|nr:9569_t:CDS:2 [Funneliformis geosporum]CAI2175111.1 5382_t:CDS:2 [Funneliformis geosporum]